MSVTSTAISIPVILRISSRMRAAERSASSGNRIARPSAMLLDSSIPALAQTHPGPVSTINTPLSMRTIRLVCLSTSSTARGSFCQRAAYAAASAEGSMSLSSQVRPSAFEITFWHTTRISPRAALRPLAAIAEQISPPRLSPWLTSGMPSIAVKVTDRIAPSRVAPSRTDGPAYYTSSARRTTPASRAERVSSAMMVSVTTARIPSFSIAAAVRRSALSSTKTAHKSR